MSLEQQGEFRHGGAAEQTEAVDGAIPDTDATS